MFSPLSTSLLTKKEEDKIKEWTAKQTLNLIYSATKDGFDPATFHNKCDNKVRIFLVFFNYCLCKGKKKSLFIFFFLVNFNLGPNNCNSKKYTWICTRWICCAFMGLQQYIQASRWFIYI
jgi:hypothetical protein